MNERVINGAQAVVHTLECHGVKRVFCVPGESYLAVLDALYDVDIETITARHEGGAAMMAEATAKLTGTPGVCLVTRGPGACNAAAAIHIAEQDATPLVILIGQVARVMRGRRAFQEVDYHQLFGKMAKAVFEPGSAAEVTVAMQQAFAVALAARPGPVVVVLAEDVLTETYAAARVPEPFIASQPQPVPQASVDHFRQLCGNSKKPLLIVGGSVWDADTVIALQQWAQAWQLPVICSFRRQRLFNHVHPLYAGDLGIGVNPALRSRIDAADLIILLGEELSEIPSQAYTVLQLPEPRQTLVQIHPDAAELNKVYQSNLAINTTPAAFMQATPRTAADMVSARSPWLSDAHQDYLAWSDHVPMCPGELQLGEILAWLRDRLPAASTLTNGAGNYTAWLHRMWRYRHFSSQLAPVSGSMGYGLPAAIAAKFHDRDAMVICFAGDGCFQMTSQEFSMAVQYHLPIIVIIVDNAMYGTIRMHQERHYPGRVIATRLNNPDFAALARASGGFGDTVERTAEFAPAFERALASRKPAIIHLKLDPEAVTPTQSLRQIRDTALAGR